MTAPTQSQDARRLAPPRVEHVLAAVDGSADSSVALRYAAEIARAFGGRVRALFVKDVKMLASTALAALPSLGERLEAAVAAEADEALGRARDVCGRLGVPFETEAVRGVVPLVLVEAAARADLVAMGRWGDHALWATGLLGSAVECVVRKVQRPVLVCSGTHEPARRVLVAHDGSERARSALFLGAAVASACGLPLALLHVEGRDAGAADRATAILRGAAADLEAHFPGLAREDLLHGGVPAPEIAAEADPRTLTFMGAYGHSPMRELILGSVTEEVMRRARGPVVLCR